MYVYTHDHMCTGKQYIYQYVDILFRRRLVSSETTAGICFYSATRDLLRTETDVINPGSQFVFQFIQPGSHFFMDFTLCMWALLRLEEERAFRENVKAFCTTESISFMHLSCMCCHSKVIDSVMFALLNSSCQLSACL